MAKKSKELIELERKEEKRKKELAALLLLLLLKKKSVVGIQAAFPALVAATYTHLLGSRTAGARLSKKHLASDVAVAQASETEALVILSAASNVVTTVIRNLHIEIVVNGKKGKDAVAEAVEKSVPTMDRATTTETFSGYNNQTKKSVKKETQLKWSAVLDQRVCPICESRDGKIYTADTAPKIPAHPLCRCCLILA